MLCDACVCVCPHSRAVAASSEELYRCVEDMCLHSFAPLLYSRLEAVVAKHVGGVMGAPGLDLT